MKTWSVLLFLVTVLFLGFFTLPMQQEIDSLRSENELLEQQKETNIARLEQFKSAENDVSSNKTDLLSKVPREKNQSDIIRDLRNLATNTGFSFTQIAFSESENKEVNAKEVRASFVIEGPKNGIVNFLTSVENNRRFMGIENINVQTSERNEEEIATVSVTLYAFYQR